MFIALVVFGCGSKENEKHGSSPEPIIVTDFTDEYTFTAGVEGPALGHQLYAVNFEHEGTIGEVNKSGACDLFIELPQGSIGNAIQFHQDSLMYVADYTGHQILAIDTTSKTITSLFQDSTMNQPNDFTISGLGTFYMSDPNWADSTGNLWMYKSGVLTCVDSNMGTTNGITMSTNQQFLYVNESIQRQILKFEIDKNGVPIDKKVFFSFEDGGLDGMKCDKNGNLWVTRYGKGEVVVINKKGDQLLTINLKGEKPTNLVLKENSESITAFVTIQDRGCIEKVVVSKNHLNKLALTE